MRNRIVASLMVIVMLVVTVMPTSPFIYQADAGIAEDMEGFLDDMGAMSNIQEPGSFSAGGRNVFGGASLSMRFDTTQPPLVTFSPPSLRASCSGLDFNSGLISILNLDMIQDLLEQSGSSLAWGLLIGLAYSLPTVKNVFETVQKIVRYIQQLQGNACEIGKKLGVGLGNQLFKTGHENKEASEDVAGGSAGTFAEAWEDIWNDPGQFAKNTTGNFVYDAISDLPGSGLSDDLKYAMMGMFGTIEWFPDSALPENGGKCTPDNPEEANVIYRVHSPAISVKPEDVINKLLNGGKIDSYSCGSNCINVIGGTSCTNLSPDTRQINRGLVEDVRTQLTVAVESFANRQTIPAEAKNYISVPVTPSFSDLILYLSAKKRLGEPVNLDIDLLAHYYSYSLLQYIITYMSDILHKNKSLLMGSPDLPAGLTENIETFFQTYRETSGKIYEIIEKEQRKFLDTVDHQGFINQFLLTENSRQLNSLANGVFSSLGSMNK